VTRRRTRRAEPTQEPAGAVLAAEGYDGSPEEPEATVASSTAREIVVPVQAVMCEAPSCASQADCTTAATIPVASLYVPGTPRPKQSGRFVRGRFVSQATADRGIRIYRERIERMAREALDAQGGPAAVAERVKAAGGTAGLWLRVRWVFATEQRNRWGELHTSRPDTDNLLKLLMDALSKAGWFHGWRSDDAAVAKPDVVKVWGQSAGAGFELRAFVPSTTTKREAPSCGDEAGEAPAWLHPFDGVPSWVIEGTGTGEPQIGGEADD
jgi:Holliday junction resolvase RusA-like endonuclease